MSSKTTILIKIIQYIILYNNDNDVLLFIEKDLCRMISSVMLRVVDVKR